MAAKWLQREKIEICYTKDADGVEKNLMDPQILTGLEILMIVGQILARVFIFKKQGQ